MAGKTGICLHALIAREEAVIKRVIVFSEGQGRDYVLTSMQDARIVIVSDDAPVNFDEMNPAGCMIVRIAEATTEQPYDVLMSRPLLVTRVMRTLDEAHALLASEFADAPEGDHSEETGGETEVAPSDSLTAETNDVSLERTDDKTDTPEPAGETKRELTEQVISQAGASMGVVELAETESVEEPDETHRQEAEQQETEQQETEQQETEQQETETAESIGKDSSNAEQYQQAESADDDVEAAEAESTDGDAEAAEADLAFHHHALVVDDSAAIRKQLEIELRQAGISTDFAEDGEQALEKVAAGQYDLIFLDIIMPGIDGYETCRQMRTRSELKKTPIIMLSAKTSPLDEVQGVIAGASTYLTKPVKSDQLQKTLNRVSSWLDNFSGG